MESKMEQPVTYCTIFRLNILSFHSNSTGYLTGLKSINSSTGKDKALYGHWHLDLHAVELK